MGKHNCVDIELSWQLSLAEVERLSDALTSLSVSNTVTLSQADRDNVLMGSRVIRRLLSAYERAAGRRIQFVSWGG